MFTFSLQTLLDYRKRIEEERQVELAGEKRMLDEERRKLDSILLEEEKNLGELNRVVDKASPAPLVAALLSRGERLQRERTEQEQSVRQAASRVEESRNRLAEAMKDKEMLEKLKEKRMKAYQMDEARRATRANDEAGRSAARYRGKS